MTDLNDDATMVIAVGNTAASWNLVLNDGNWQLVLPTQSDMYDVVIDTASQWDVYEEYVATAGKWELRAQFEFTKYSTYTPAKGEYVELKVVANGTTVDDIAHVLDHFEGDGAIVLHIELEVDITSTSFIEVYSKSNVAGSTGYLQLLHDPTSTYFYMRKVG